MWSNKTKADASSGLFPGRTIFGPLLLMATTPITAVLFVHVFCAEGGAVMPLVDRMAADGFWTTLMEIWPTPFNAQAWKIIGIFMAVQLAFIKLVPGPTVYGPITPGGNRPEYTSNGFKCYVLSLVLYVAGAYFGLFEGGIAYSHMPHIISALNVFSLLLCGVIYIKGMTFPSSTDCGSTGNIIFDYFAGVELYPRIFGWDVKLFTNCRCGMMYWGIAIVSYAWKQYEILGYVSDSMLTSVALQLVYVGKFFWWEDGYMRSIDIMHDRAGYYLCWGCLVWVPSVYTSQTLYLVANPIELGTPLALGLFFTGCMMVYINYWADEQRMEFRSTEGKCIIWGKKPEYITASYTTEKGEKKQSLLLTCGWWGVSRHFHYIPEILAALCWSLPALASSCVPYFYVTFLTILLCDRAFRDDARCRAKYGKDWDKYCERVPKLIVPGIL
ncbi:7-dehydrocholesterol reductase [Thraustotheca clavata]|uniref:7-dehydrocholesterol reductase n=1 Tax=Thraustotheca clavata TaxID=74557 RepID=A0A1V9Z646_9STRA|nr:7-dehydrocholesterol reductase [Thraustotheca clavata]